MNECKYCLDEICVNDKCPMCADYCPVVDFPGVCRYEVRAKPMTNADRIRAMTDEELAALVPCPGDGGCDNKDKWDCKECCLSWLQQPVKEDAE